MVSGTSGCRTWIREISLRQNRSLENPKGEKAPRRTFEMKSRKIKGEDGAI